MKRFLAALVIATLCSGSAFAIPTVASAEPSSRAPTSSNPRRAPSTPVDLAGTWIGMLPGSDVAVAVISDGRTVRAYVCDGAAVSAWFEGELVGNSFSMSAPDGSTIAGAVGDTVIGGVFTSTDAPMSGAFTVRQPTGGGGVFRSHFIESDGTATFIRWIVFDDGTQRGNAEKTPLATTSAPPAETPPPTTTAAPTTTSPPPPTATAAPPPTVTEPAPPLDVQAARTDASAPVGPAAAPAPVTELTPTSIVAPVPTTQLSGAPPPVEPPTAPALQPVTVAVSINPAKADVGAPVRYELTLTNPNSTEVTDAGVGVGLPPSLAVVEKTERSTCKGSFVAFPPGTTKPGQPQVVVSAVALAPRASCTAGVDITATAPTAVDVVTDAPAAAGAPAGVPARATFVFSSTVAAPANAPAPTTTTTKPATTTTKPVATTTTQPATTTTTKAPTTSTTASAPTTSSPGAAPAAATASPSAVRNVRAVPVPIRPGERPFAGSVEFQFDPPSSDGGSPIAGFVAQCGGALGGPPETLAEVEGASSPLTLSNLLVGVDINCLVGATNQAGRRSPPVFVQVRIPPVAPSSVRNVTAQALARRPGDGPTDVRVQVSFDPPAQDGSSPVVRFEALCGEDGFFDDKEAAGASSPLTVTGLPADRIITCAVEAINRDGFRGLPAFAEPVELRSPRTPTPSAVRNVRATVLPINPGERPFAGSVEFRFDPPSSDGGSPITTFVVQCGGALGGPPEELAEVEGASSPLTLSGLPVGVDINCLVGATNQAGRRSPPVFVQVRIPPVAPSSVRNVTAQALARRPGDGPTDVRVQVSFDPPAQEGSSPVVRFEALCGEDGFFDDKEAAGASSPLTVTGLPADRIITCAVEAINRDGFRGLPAFAEPVELRSPRTPTPSAVRNVRATVLPINPGERPFAGSVEFRFDPPVDDGGAPITGFEALCGGPLGGPLEDAAEVSGPASPLTISGLPIGVDLRCGVGAVNQSGRRSSLATVSVRVPPATPSPPRELVARALPLRAGDGPTDGRIEVSFSPPADDGDSDSLEFGVLCAFTDGSTPPEEVIEGRGTSSPIGLAGFLVGVPYSCQAVAQNEAGVSPLAFADPVTVLAPGTPSAPRDPSARALPLRAGDGRDDGRVEVSFLPPTDDGGGAIVNFGVDCATTAAPDVVDGSADGTKSPIVVTGLTIEVEYRCSITAFTDAGGVSPVAPTNAVTVTRTPTTTTRPPTPPTPSAPNAVTNPVARVAIPSAPRDVEARPLPLRDSDGPSDARVDVAFLAPEDDGGSPIARFDAQCSTFVPPGVTGVPNNVAATAKSSPVTVSGLQVDLPYSCSVTAITEAELEGPAGFTSKDVTVAGRPGPPRGVEARALPLGAAGPQEGRAEVSITPPSDNGSPAITGFVARCETRLPATRPGETGSLLVAEGFSATSPVTVAGLVVDFPYECSGAAVNRIGEGQGIRATSIAVRGALSGARDVQATPLPLRPADGATDGRVEVSFLPPEGGAPAESFAVTCISPPVSRALGQPLEVSVTGDASPVTVEGIHVDRTYTCNVVGINQVGRGAAAFAPPVVVRGFPGAPRDVEARALPLRAGDGADDGRAELSFRPPEDGGAPEVTSFSARCESPTTTPAGVPSSLVAVSLNQRGSPITVSGLRVDVEYRCHVAATNRIGEGTGALAAKTVTVTATPAPTTTSAPPTSTTTTTLPVDAKPPGRPGPPVANALAPRPGDGASDGRVSVEFTSPDDGGSPITGFLVTCQASATSSGAASGRSSPITVTGLPAGFRYGCVVQAENAVGLGEPSARSNVVAVEIPPSVLTPPSAPPGRPTATALLPLDDDGPSDGRITVEFFEAEKDGGSPIIRYIVTCTDTAGNFSVAEIGPKSPITVTGIPYGFSYVCVVQAENSLAPGDASRTSNAVRLPIPPSVQQVPSRPREVVAEALASSPVGAADGRVSVRFIEPETDGGSPVTGYDVLCTDNAQVGATGSGASSPITLTGFPPGDYVCDLRAINDIGPSNPSHSNMVTIRAAAAKPLLVVEPPGGASPLPTTFRLENPPEKITAWVLDFGDGTPKVEGRGAVPVVPHTYVDTTKQAVTLAASLTITPEGAERQVFTQRVEVQPEGTVLSVSGSPEPASFRRGESGFVTFSVRNPNASPVPGPLTLSVSPGAAVTFATGAWTCDRSACTLAPGLDAFAEAPRLVASVTAPPDAPATIELPITVTGGSGQAETVVRIPIVGVLANAGPDQTVDATTPQPDGTLAPTRVLLDGSGSLGLDGRNQQFSWRQVAGESVRLIRNVDPTERVVAFDAPSVPGQRVLEFELTVAEGTRESKDRVLVTVFPRNQPPVLERITVGGLATRTSRNGEIVPDGRGTLQLTSVASDPDKDALTTTWRVITEGVPNSTASGEKFSLDWPIAGVPQVIVEAAVTDPRGATDTDTVTLGVAPEPLGLAVEMPARVDPGEQVTATATPSRTSGVEVQWGLLAGPAIPGFPKSGRTVTFDAPNVTTTQMVTFTVTATETATGARASREVAMQIDAPPPFVVVAPPAVSVDLDEQATIEATVTGGANATFSWRRNFGPDVTLEGADSRTVRFRAPSVPTTVGLRFSATAGGVTRSADTVVTVGAAAAPPPSGCSDGSAYRQLAQGGPLVLAGVAVVSGGNTQGTNASCDEAAFDGVDINIFDGLVIGDGLSGTFDEDGIRFTGGEVRLPDAFRLPPIDLGGSPLRIAFPGSDDGGTAPTGGGGTAPPGSGGTAPVGGGGAPGGGDACVTWDVGFASRDFPFVPLPPGFSSGGAHLAVSCTAASITAEATTGGATFAVDATLADGGADATMTLTDVPLLGGTASGTGSIVVAPGGAPTYDLTATIDDPQLPVPGITLDTATARLTPAGLTVAAEGALGQGNGALALSLEGSFTESGLSLAVDANNAGPWAVAPELSVDAANLVGTIDVDAAGTTTLDLRLSVGGDWRPVPGLRVRQLALQVSNEGVPRECAIPAGGVWVRVGGEGAIEIPGVSPLALAVEACIGPPSDASVPAFSMRSTVGGPQWQVADGVVIRDVGIHVTFVDDSLTLQASGGATLLGLDLTARVLFLVPSGGGQPAVVVDAAGSLAGLGVPITSGHVVFASAAVPDFALEPGVQLDLPQGITGVGTIDLGQPIADLLNDVFDPPTPVLPVVTVTLSFGAAIEIKAAISLGGDGATLFMGCAGGGTNCNPTAPTTTRLALDSAFIRLVLGGSGGFSIGFGGDGTLNLPPAEVGGPASPLDLHVEASIQPPARVGLALFFEGQWQNAMGLSGLHMSNLGIQGSIDFSTTPIPTVTMGITGQVDRVPDQLADVLGLTNNGEPLRFTVNVDPLAPILEMTLGIDDGGIVMRPLAGAGQPDALEVDFASVVIAPLGGTVGPVTYSPGVSAGFGANILDVPVHLNASVDIAAAHINGTVEVGTLTVGGVRFEDTTILLDITPTRFRQTLCGGVHVGSTTLQGLLHIQAGSGGGGPASCGGVNVDPGGGSGLRARFRINAASLPVGPVTVQQLVVDAQANLDALSANFDATLNATANLNVLANTLNMDGTIKFGNNTLQELHVRARGNVNVGGVQVTGDGSCPFGAPGSGSGACVQLDHAPATSTPFRLGLKGKLTAAGSTATVTGALDSTQASLSGSLSVPTLGSLDVSGSLVFGGAATIRNATGATVSAEPGDWRVSGQFGSPEPLAGGVSAAWAFAAGRVSNGLFVRGSANTSIGGANVQLAGTFSSSGSGNLSYSLTGSANGAVSGSVVNLATTGGGTLDVLHSAIRTGVFNFPVLSPIGGRPSDERFPERMQGRLHFDASYGLSATLTQNGLDIDEADIAARVVYGERFDRDGNGTFAEETSNQRNTLVNFDLDAGGIDEFFEMAVAGAASRTTAPTFCFGLFGNAFGDC